jgi:hypothetical protein
MAATPNNPSPRPVPAEAKFTKAQPTTKTTPVPATPPIEDFINTYTRWADVVELPREAHEATAIQLIATLLNRNGVFINNGRIKYSMDLWMALLSESGGGRSTSLEAIDQVLQVADAETMAKIPKEDKAWGFNLPSPLRDIINNDRWGSPQTMFQGFSTKPYAGLFVWGEMSEKLALLSSGPFKQYGAKQWITDRYDLWKPPEKVMYRVTGKESDTPPIEFDEAPRINILAGSSKDWFYRFLTSDDSGGGWLPRWCIIHLPPRSRSVSRPIDVAPDLIAPMARWLQNASTLQGEATMPEEIWQHYDEWYRDMQKEFESHANRALAVPYWNRHKGHILKLAVTYTVSMGDGLVVTPEAWKRAVAKARELKDSVFKILENGATAAGYDLKRYHDRIVAAGADGLLRSEFTRGFQHDSKKDRVERLETLLETGAVHMWMSKTPGRSGQMLVVAELCGGRCGKCGEGGAASFDPDAAAKYAAYRADLKSQGLQVQDLSFTDWVKRGCRVDATAPTPVEPADGNGQAG